MTNRVNGRCTALPQTSAAPRKKYKKYSTGTYIGLIAYAIQDSPDKMLTFKEIMKKLEPYVFGDKKGIENNIRVCLSSNKCFAKVPVDPDFPNPKKNFWKVDESGITAKMYRRHFKYITNVFPGLSIQPHQVAETQESSQAPEPEPVPAQAPEPEPVPAQAPEPEAVPAQAPEPEAVPAQAPEPEAVPAQAPEPEPEPAPANAVAETQREVKFTGPFSIESLLKNDREVTPPRSTSLEENPYYYLYDYNAVDRYYAVSAFGYQLVSAKLPPFEMPLPPQITYDPNVLLGFPFMHDARYVKW